MSNRINEPKKPDSDYRIVGLGNPDPDVVPCLNKSEVEVIPGEFCDRLVCAVTAKPIYEG